MQKQKTPLQKLQEWAEFPFKLNGSGVIGFDEAGLMSKINELLLLEKQQILDAYNEGYRDGEHDKNITNNKKDIAEFGNAITYFKQIYGEDEKCDRDSPFPLNVPFDFVIWYSGMAKEKILASFERYVKEKNIQA